MVSTDSDSCRICFENGTDENPLLSPCVCRGSAAFIHGICILQHYRSHKKWWEMSCPECHIMYSGKIAVELGHEGLACCERSHGQQSPQFVYTLNSLAEIYGRTGNFEKQEELLERALTIADTNEESHQDGLNLTLCSLGNACAKMGDKKRALQILERALSLQEKREKGGIEAMLLRADLGRVHGELGGAEASKELLEFALPVLRQQLGTSHRLVADAEGDLGVAYGMLGNTEQHMLLCEHAYVILERAMGPEHRAIANTLVKLGKACGLQGDTARQQKLLKRAIAIKEREFGSEHPQVKKLQADLAAVQGQLPEKHEN